MTAAAPLTKADLVARGYELAGEDCASCDTPMVISLDALKRPRKRCPHCQGVTAQRPPHPDQVLTPITLAALSAIALPHVEPGQLRCQQCAKGVKGHARFCASCEAARRSERQQLKVAARPPRPARKVKPTTRPCPRCGAPTPIRRGRPPKDCEACR